LNRKISGGFAGENRAQRRINSYRRQTLRGSGKSFPEVRALLREKKELHLLG